MTISYIKSPATIQEYSVSQFSNQLKHLIESNYGFVRIKGEISGFKLASSGHGYFNLKDDTAVLFCACWRPVMAKLKNIVVDGIEVVVLGKVTTYAGQSRYQLTVQHIELSGSGSFMKLLQERRERLSKEGLFEAVHKKKIPFLPRRIGVITSLTGAVIKDILHRITERFPTNIIIWPTSTQGDNAAVEIETAIVGLNALPLKPDIIIIARGGGSIEDLWCFNEEIVVRAAFNSSIPIISAIGHETDYTLLDLVADKRAPTPTAAAEFAVPVLSNLMHTIDNYHRFLISKFQRLIKYYQQSLFKYNNFLNSSNNYLAFRRQKLDEVGFRLLDSLPSALKYKKLQLASFDLGPSKIKQSLNYKTLELNTRYDFLVKSLSKCTSLGHQKLYELDFKLNDALPDILKYKKLKLASFDLGPNKIKQLINYKKLQINTKEENLLKNGQTKISSTRLKLDNLSNLLNSLSYKSSLKRGYAVVRSFDGKVIADQASAKLNEQLNIEFYDGSVDVKIEKII